MQLPLSSAIFVAYIIVPVIGRLGRIVTNSQKHCHFIVGGCVPLVVDSCCSVEF